MKKETRVKFADGDSGMVGFGNNDDPNIYLTLGNIYTVFSVDVHSWHTKIMLNEMPGRWFNDRHFQEIQ